VTTASGAKRLGNGARGLSPWDVMRVEVPGRTGHSATSQPAERFVVTCGHSVSRTQALWLVDVA
jgi:hypothetical protein